MVIITIIIARTIVQLCGASWRYCECLSSRNLLHYHTHVPIASARNSPARFCFLTTLISSFLYSLFTSHLIGVQPHFRSMTKPKQITDNTTLYSINSSTRYYTLRYSFVIDILVCNNFKIIIHLTSKQAA